MKKVSKVPEKSTAFAEDDMFEIPEDKKRLKGKKKKGKKGKKSDKVIKMANPFVDE